MATCLEDWEVTVPKIEGLELLNLLQLLRCALFRQLFASFKPIQIATRFIQKIVGAS
jgi:hypothetical protein